MTISMQTSPNRTIKLTANSSGTFTWKVSEDTVYADSVVATLFGIPERDAEQGLPLNRFLQAIYPDDLQGVSKAIAGALKSGSPYRAEYRVVSSTGKISRVLAMGRCFCDTTGRPIAYSGMLFDMTPDETTLWQDEEMVENCVAAFKAAKRAGNELVTYLLSMALIEIGQQAAGDLIPEDCLH